MRKVAIAIGVESFADRRFNRVNFADSDAQRFMEAMTSLGVSTDDSMLLTGKSATAKEAQGRLEELISTLSPDCTFYFFYVGLGIIQNEISYLACSDSRSQDLPGTSLSLDWVTSVMRNGRQSKTVLFLDAFRGELSEDLRENGYQQGVSPVGLEEFATNAAGRVCFLPCQLGESSRSHGSLKHGVWVNHILESLEGKVSNATYRKTSLTSRSLQNYLKGQVPRTIRTLFTGTATQTPCAFGDVSSAMAIADLKPVIQTSALFDGPSQQQFQSLRLVHEQTIPVKNLSGFDKSIGHFIPERVNAASMSFLASVAATDLNREIDEIFQALKGQFQLKRLDITANVDGTSGSIVTPHFDYEIAVSLLDEAPSDALVRQQIVNIRHPERILGSEFDRVFSGRFDSLEFASGKPIQIEEIVDRVEALDSLEMTVQYDHELTYCTVLIPAHNIQIEVNSKRYRITQLRKGTLKALLQSFFNVQRSLTD
ncbi:caspase family protein [Planctomicrobium sp. SH668]|uniref:caspase family protein n=1 Tax=Planctomicrobium sp. SH668 TaxID=3448126 RepID=UPI003F5B25A6